MPDTKKIMNAKAETVSAVKSTDVALLTLAAVLVIAGVAAYYLLPRGVAPGVRAACVIGGLVVAGAAVWFTAVGRGVRSYMRETQFEMRKVVWPTREETIRTTVVVVIVVVALSIVLGLIDVLLKWAILDHLLKL